MLSVTLVGYPAAKIIYNLFFHPLRRYPGPKLWAATSIPQGLNIWMGRPHKKLLAMHKRYGNIVRIAPGELSLTHPDSWKEIQGHVKQGQPENGKDPKLLNPAFDSSLVSAPRHRHGPMRRTLAAAFSVRALAAQQPLINGFIDLLIQRLREKGENGAKSLNMTKWYEWATFDIIGNLALGESFQCLERSGSHPYVDNILNSLKVLPLNQALHYFPIPAFLRGPLFVLLAPKEVLNGDSLIINYSRETLNKRRSLGSERPDFVDAMLKKGGEYKMTETELIDNTRLLTSAGAETTGTTLVTATYLLCTHPDVLTKLKAEVRSTFKSDAEIDFNNVQNLPFLGAVISETMRVHPAAPAAFQRITPPGGSMVFGDHLSAGTTLGIWQWVAYHDPSNFLYPDAFIPDRWVNDRRFDNDNKDIFQPFSYGPRNCIGMNLAFVELRLILARIVFNYDMELAPESRGWADDQELFSFWNKPTLNVHFKSRKAE
ncbi:hypothetical protein INS49_006224 [Diaporthe citri]|uniref:uncharacterized protein n=1 Tax=Diaporthe citri TaxID=83186 RepID=UPI001C7FD132|nr:uncharacterized protein INS49_006224 [Diaporthe citri]KAG6364621.1 hypothetical protein INS49_006224 [Diaporthe citri]